MAQQTVASVERRGNEYVALSPDGYEMGRAGALNVNGAAVSVSDGVQMYFGGELVSRVNDDMHSDGVLFVEREG
jgi:hypothetical protein